MLNRGGWANPDVLLVEGAAGPVVVKDYAPRAAFVRATIGRIATRREQAAYRRLAHLDVVPDLLGPIDSLAFALEYRPGEPLSRSLRGRLPSGFYGDLVRAVEAMHALGVAHLDLSHRSNVLAGQDGRPVVLDLASAVWADPSTRLGRAWIGMAGALDRRALRKWRARIVPESQSAASSLAGASASGATSAGSRGDSRPM